MQDDNSVTRSILGALVVGWVVITGRVWFSRWIDACVNHTTTSGLLGPAMWTSTGIIVSCCVIFGLLFWAITYFSPTHLVDLGECEVKDLLPGDHYRVDYYSGCYEEYNVQRVLVIPERDPMVYVCHTDGSMTVRLVFERVRILRELPK